MSELLARLSLTMPGRVLSAHDRRERAPERLALRELAVWRDRTEARLLLLALELERELPARQLNDKHAAVVDGAIKELRKLASEKLGEEQRRVTPARLGIPRQW